MLGKELGVPILVFVVGGLAGSVPSLFMEAKAQTVALAVVQPTVLRVGKVEREQKEIFKELALGKLELAVLKNAMENMEEGVNEAKDFAAKNAQKLDKQTDLLNQILLRLPK
tara:strand:+ start:849 stop:1184 length:336 start_codon:yes stop_codon:yes gene_type:complete